MADHMHEHAGAAGYDAKFGQRPTGAGMVRMQAAHAKLGKALDDNPDLVKGGGPFIGPKGGKWADSKHTIAWKEGKSPSRQRQHAHAGSNQGFHRDHAETTPPEHHELRWKHHGAAREAAQKQRSARRGSNAWYAHGYERKYHDQMADAHYGLGIGKAAYGGMAGHDHLRVKEALSLARLAQQDHEDATAGVKAAEPPSATMGKTPSGKPMHLMSARNFRDLTHEMSSEDHDAYSKEHTARSDDHYAMSDQLQREGKWSESAKYNRAGRYHSDMGVAHGVRAKHSAGGLVPHTTIEDAHGAAAVSRPGGSMRDKALFSG